MTDWQTRAVGYADMLAADGHITDPAWHKVFATTPRHLFVPRYWALDEYNSPATLVDGDNPRPARSLAGRDLLRPVPSYPMGTVHDG